MAAAGGPPAPAPAATAEGCARAALRVFPRLNRWATARAEEGRLGGDLSLRQLVVLAFVREEPATLGELARPGLVGGKGAGLAEMTQAGLPVPPGFTITTAACRHALAHEGAWPEGLWDEVVGALAGVERATGRRFGDPADPLLLSVRSGA